MDLTCQELSASADMKQLRFLGLRASVFKPTQVKLLVRIATGASTANANRSPTRLFLVTLRRKIPTTSDVFDHEITRRYR